MISGIDLDIGYGGRTSPEMTSPIFEGLSFHIAAGEVVALVGPSGGGKTTLLRVLAGLLRPSRGSLQWASGRFVGHWYIPQTPALLEFRTALENICMSREFRRRINEQDVAVALTILNELGLAAAGDRRPHALSGGMRRRVALGQALYSEDALLLLDEPFAELDLGTRRRAETAVDHNVRAAGRTVVFATHDLDSATAIADRLIILTGCGGSPAELPLASFFPDDVKTPQGRRSHPLFSQSVGAVQQRVVETMATTS